MQRIKTHRAVIILAAVIGVVLLAFLTVLVLHRINMSRPESQELSTAPQQEAPHVSAVEEPQLPMPTPNVLFCNAEVTFYAYESSKDYEQRTVSFKVSKTLMNGAYGAWDMFENVEVTVVDRYGNTMALLPLEVDTSLWNSGNPEYPYMDHYKRIYTFSVSSDYRPQDTQVYILTVREGDVSYTRYVFDRPQEPTHAGDTTMLEYLAVLEYGWHWGEKAYGKEPLPDVPGSALVMLYYACGKNFTSFAKGKIIKDDEDQMFTTTIEEMDNMLRQSVGASLQLPIPAESSSASCFLRDDGSLIITESDYSGFADICDFRQNNDGTMTVYGTTGVSERFEGFCMTVEPAEGYFGYRALEYEILTEEELAQQLLEFYQEKKVAIQTWTDLAALELDQVFLCHFYPEVYAINGFTPESMVLLFTFCEERMARYCHGTYDGKAKTFSTSLQSLNAMLQSATGYGLSSVPVSAEYSKWYVQQGESVQLASGDQLIWADDLQVEFLQDGTIFMTGNGGANEWMVSFSMTVEPTQDYFGYRVTDFAVTESNIPLEA